MFYVDYNMLYDQFNGDKFKIFNIKNKCKILLIDDKYYDIKYKT